MVVYFFEIFESEVGNCKPEMVGQFLDLLFIDPHVTSRLTAAALPAADAFKLQSPTVPGFRMLCHLLSIVAVLFILRQKI